MDWSRRTDSPIRNMLTESYPKDVHLYRPMTVSQERNPKALDATEYRRSFALEEKDTGKPQHAAGVTSIPTYYADSYRRRAPGNNSYSHSDISNRGQKSDWTTSYMQDFPGAPTKGKNKSKRNSAINLASGPENVVNKGRDATATDAIACKTESVTTTTPAKAEKTESTTSSTPTKTDTAAGCESSADKAQTSQNDGDQKSEKVGHDDSERNTTEKNQVHSSVHVSPSARKIDRGDAMRMIMSPLTCVPSTIPSRTFDDNQNATPVLRSFINSISRK